VPMWKHDSVKVICVGIYICIYLTSASFDVGMVLTYRGVGDFLDMGLVDKRSFSRQDR